MGRCSLRGRCPFKRGLYRKRGREPRSKSGLAKVSADFKSLLLGFHCYVEMSMIGMSLWKSLVRNCGISFEETLRFWTMFFVGKCLLKEDFFRHVWL